MISDPDYARIFTKTRIWAWSYGYSCCLQGTATRDLDLLLIPWTEEATLDGLQRIIAMLADSENLKLVGDATVRPHGRLSYTLIFSAFGDPRFVDISAFPPKEKT